MFSENFHNKKYLSIRVGGRLLDLSTPRVMGILNATPDSFYPGSRLMSGDSSSTAALSGNAERRVRGMLADGADIIDVGAYSTRPGCADISPSEEYDRLAPALEGARRAGGSELVISVDTFRAQVAEKCVRDWGVQIVNDIGGGTLDPEMYETVAGLGVAYILMHTRGTPQTMGNFTGYGNVAAEVITDLAFKADRLHSLGVADVIIDPGFGFAKTPEENFRMLRDLGEFAKMGMPLLCGISRKSMIWKTLGADASASLNGTTVLNTVALMKGADILRVHDVKEARECVSLVTRMREAGA